MEWSRFSGLRRLLFFLAILVVSPVILGCGSPGEDAQEGGSTTIVFKHGKLAGDDDTMAELISRFEVENPDIQVIEEILPSNTDQQRQFYVTNLEAGSSDFDVFALDVIWTPEFSRAGWLLDLSDVINEVEREDFLAGPLRANTFEGRLYAAPWYVDGGVLFYRSDLLNKHRIAVPETFEELVNSTKFILKEENDEKLYGFIWQGKQYEGLVCTAMEFIHGNGAEVIQGDQVVLDSPKAIEAIGFMRILIEEGVSPALVTTADEEATRNLFGGGRAIYTRNWPYAWNTFQQEGSEVQGKIGITTMPRFAGGQQASTLGGWQLGINKNSEHPEAAKRFIAFLTSAEIQEQFAIGKGYKPSRTSVYYRARLQESQPFIVGLLSVMERTQPRPVTPFYPRISQVLQTEFSAVVSGIKKPDAAMKDAKSQIEKILEMDRG